MILLYVLGPRVAGLVAPAPPPRTLPAGTRATSRLDAARLTRDVHALAAPGMEGRRTGTPGGLRARTWVAGRMAENGVEPLAPGYLHRFRFDHTSIRAVVTRERPVRVQVADAANVVGVVRGQDPRLPFFVLSAHYDHVGVRDGALHPGADDNASGVAALLEIGRWLRQHPLRRTVVLAAFDAEEMGLRGARAFVASGIVPRDKLALNVNLDMIGRSDENVLVAAGTAHTPDLAAPVERAAARATIRVRFGHDRPGWRGAGDDWTDDSDHAAFHEAGVPFLYFGVEDHEDYHQPGDTPEKVQPAFLHGAAELVLEALLALDEGATGP